MNNISTLQNLIIQRQQDYPDHICTEFKSCANDEGVIPNEQQQ
jgi:hypothetical protein